MAKIKKDEPIVPENTAIKPEIVIQEVPPTVVATNQSNQSQVIIMSGARQESVAQEKIEGETFEERLLNYVKGRTNVIVNDFIKAEFKDKVGLQVFNKQMRGKLQSLVAAKKITIAGNAHQKLGGFFYNDHSTETQHYTVRNTKIEITAL